MPNKKIEREPTPEEAAVETLKQRVRTISVAYEHVAAAENRMPLDKSVQPEDSNVENVVNVVSTPSDPQADDSKMEAA